MIIEKIETIDNIEYKLTYSDKHKKILQKETGIIYDDALDTINSNFTYEELDIDSENTDSL